MTARAGAVNFSLITERNAMSVASQIEKKLSDALSPEKLEVIDESHNHRGHAGARPEGESHFRVRMVAAAFQGKSRVECHRMINQVLAEELKQQIHALAIEAKPPE
jgi:BolA family transcriptional regulator, general stress-responsive regulator